MSTHRVEVVRIDRIEKHPNADALGIVKVRGWTCCVKLGQFQDSLSAGRPTISLD